jgi:hypothetical protein
MSSGYAQIALRHCIGSANATSFPDNYRVFGLFRPTTILNYNLDGQAERWCTGRHRVVSMHGIVPEWWGSTEARKTLHAAQELDIEAHPIPEILLEAEQIGNLPPMPRIDDFGIIVIVGYTFGRYGDALDDAVSFDLLCASLAACPRPVVVIDPAPDNTAHLIAERAKNRHVYEAPLYWNIFAGAMLAAARHGDAASIERAYDTLGTDLL